MPQSVSSSQVVKGIPPCGISDVKEDLDELIQFPEGGAAAWCLVIGGWVPLFSSDIVSDTICCHERALVQFCGFG